MSATRKPLRPRRAIRRHHCPKTATQARNPLARTTTAQIPHFRHPQVRARTLRVGRQVHGGGQQCDQYKTESTSRDADEAAGHSPRAQSSRSYDGSEVVDEEGIYGFLWRIQGEPALGQFAGLRGVVTAGREGYDDATMDYVYIGKRK